MKGTLFQVLEYESALGDGDVPQLSRIKRNHLSGRILLASFDRYVTPVIRFRSRFPIRKHRGRWTATARTALVKTGLFWSEIYEINDEFNETCEKPLTLKTSGGRLCQNKPTRNSLASAVPSAIGVFGRRSFLLLGRGRIQVVAFDQPKRFSFRQLEKQFNRH